MTPALVGAGKKYKNCCLGASGEDSFSKDVNISGIRLNDDIIPLEAVIDYGQPFTDGTEGLRREKASLN